MATATVRVGESAIQVPLIPDSYLFTNHAGQPEFLPAAEVETWDFGLARPWWYTSTQVLRVTESTGTSDVASQDITNRVTTPSHVATDYQLTVSDIYDPVGLTVTFTSSNPAVATVTTSGLVQWVSNGSVNITLSDGDEDNNVVVPLTVQRYPTTTSVSKFLSYNSGTLGKHICDATDALLVGANPATDKAVYSTRDHSGSGTYVRSADCWLAGVNLTAIPVWNSVSGAGGNGVAISPRHVLFAAHNCPTANGGTIRFVTADNQVIQRVMTARAYHPQTYVNGTLANDFAVVLLDEALPASITPAKVFPRYATASAKITIPDSNNSSTGFFLPVVWTDFEEKALVGGDGAFENAKSVSFGNYPQRAAFFETAIGGDSGSPVFAVLNGELAVLGVMTYAGFGVSFLYQNGLVASTDPLAPLTLGATPRIDAINSLMTALGGGHTCTEANVSSFPNKS